MRKILIVEDSPAMRGLIASIIDEHIEDCEAVEVESGFEALRWLPRESFALIITDINMPDINGLELISYVRRSPRSQTTPIVIVTSEGNQQDRDRGLALGANVYLTKPFETQELVAAVRRLLDESP